MELKEGGRDLPLQALQREFWLDILTLGMAVLLFATLYIYSHTEQFTLYKKRENISVVDFVDFGLFVFIPRVKLLCALRIGRSSHAFGIDYIRLCEICWLEEIKLTKMISSFLPRGIKRTIKAQKYSHYAAVGQFTDDT